YKHGLFLQKAKRDREARQAFQTVIDKYPRSDEAALARARSRRGAEESRRPEVLMASEKNSAEMPFLDHLEELRWRIIWSLVAVILGVAAAFFVLQRFEIFKFLEGPILPYLNGNKLKYTHPADPFSVLISASVTIGIVLALPIILYQVS